MTKLDWRYWLLTKASRFTPDVTTMSLEQLQKARAQVPPKLLSGRPHPEVRTRSIEIPTSAGTVPARMHEPTTPSAGPRPVVVYYHGGGWMAGNPDAPEYLTTYLAALADVVVVSCGYRLAPEHPFPAGLDDCVDALEWVADQADTLGVDAGRIAVGGDSAGGNLAAVVCLEARRRGGPSIRHQTLIYPATDFTWSSPSIREEGHHGILPEPQLVHIREQYLGDADATDWRASPLLANDHSGLPPAHIVVAGHDTVRDDGIRYAHALRAAGVPARLSNYTTMAHGFLNLTLAPRIRRQALDDIAGEVRDAWN